MKDQEIEVWYNERDFYQCYFIPPNMHLPVGNTLLKCINGKIAYVNIFEIENLSHPDKEAMEYINKLLVDKVSMSITEATQAKFLLDKLNNDNNNHPTKNLI